MHLGVDGRALCGQLAGIGHCVHEILLRLEVERISIFCAPSLPSIELRASWDVRVARLPRQVALKWKFREWALQSNIDVFWAPQTLLPHFGRKIPTVSTVNDLNHLLVPKTMSWGTRLAHRLWFETDVNAADVVVAISDGTAHRLRRAYKRDARIARPGVGADFFPRSSEDRARIRKIYSLPEHYLLAVSTLEPRKNIAALIAAHQHLFSKGEAPPLVLVGKSGWKTSKDSLQRPGIHLLGYVPTADLPALYSAASGYLMPSLYEGYGMPVAEARACGCRVMATDIPELREAAANQGIFVQPTEEGITSGIRTLLTSPAGAATPKTRWEDAAAIYLQAFKDAIERKH